ncbi:unnamed protein product [Amaranthus hypochondriacus]
MEGSEMEARDRQNQVLPVMRGSEIKNSTQDLNGGDEDQVMDLEYPSIGTQNTVSNEQLSSEVITSSISWKQKESQLQHSRLEGSHCREAMLNSETDFLTLPTKLETMTVTPTGREFIQRGWGRRVVVVVVVVVVMVVMVVMLG